MTPKTPGNFPLAWNFHQTFKPERQYLRAMLSFAARQGEGNIQQIGEQTGIPTGQSSGKVLSTLNYCEGMGLIEHNLKNQAIKTPQLTAFGRAVYLEDAFLKEPLSQWLAHFHLCDALCGAEAWHLTFARSTARLGTIFRRPELEDWLAMTHHESSKSLIGPLASMYNDEASFGRCQALVEKENTFERRNAPLREDYAGGYGAWLLRLMERFGKPGAQITLSLLEAEYPGREVSGWSQSEWLQLLEWGERKGLFRVDRQMTPWVLKAKLSAREAWGKLYNDLI